MDEEDSSSSEEMDEEDSSSSEEMDEEDSSSSEEMDDFPSFEYMKGYLKDMKMGDVILRSIWLYFGLPSEFIQEIPGLNDEPNDEEFSFFVAKAAVVCILKNRDVFGVLFEKIFQRCTTLDNYVVSELDQIVNRIIGRLILKNAYFEAFIKFCAILGDFILFLRWKKNFLNLDRPRLLLYWGDYYNVYFEDQLIKRVGLEAVKNEARTLVGFYPYHALAKFTSKYCNNGAPYDKENIPTMFEKEIRSYQSL